MSAVDVHAHVIVPELLRDAAPEERWRPVVRRVDSCQVVEFAGRRVKSMVHECVDLDRILAAEERAGIQHVVLSPWCRSCSTTSTPRRASIAAAYRIRAWRAYMPSNRTE